MAATDINVIAENLAELLTNSVNMAVRLYDIFINPVPMDVTLKLYDDNNRLIDVVVPNRAKDRQIALSGEGSPEGVVAANIGACYVDTRYNEVYFKVGDSGEVTGWTVVLTQSAVEAYLQNYLTTNEYMTKTATSNFLVDNEYIDRTALNTTLDTFVPTAYMSTLNGSGDLTILDNSGYTVIPTGAIRFILPTVTEPTKLHKILVQVDMTRNNIYSIDVGTDQFFDRIEPDLTVASMYNLLYEYDSAKGCWVVGCIMKGA